MSIIIAVMTIIEYWIHSDGAAGGPAKSHNVMCKVCVCRFFCHFFFACDSLWSDSCGRTFVSISSNANRFSERLADCSLWVGGDAMPSTAHSHKSHNSFPIWIGVGVVDECDGVRLWLVLRNDKYDTKAICRAYAIAHTEGTYEDAHTTFYVWGQ